MSNEPLYTVRTKLTFEEYKKYNIAVRQSQKYTKIMRVVYIVLLSFLALELLFLLGLAASFRDGGILEHSLVLFVSAAVLVVVILLQQMVSEHMLRKAYNTDKAAIDAEIVTRFYSDHMEGESKAGTWSLKYEDIYKIIETNTNLYIMQSTVKGHFFKKDECPDGLVEFINSLKK